MRWCSAVSCCKYVELLWVHERCHTRYKFEIKFRKKIKNTRVYFSVHTTTDRKTTEAMSRWPTFAAALMKNVLLSTSPPAQHQNKWTRNRALHFPRIFSRVCVHVLPQAWQQNLPQESPPEYNKRRERPNGKAEKEDVSNLVLSVSSNVEVWLCVYVRGSEGASHAPSRRSTGRLRAWHR
jgi:hypothetical protein